MRTTLSAIAMLGLVTTIGLTGCGNDDAPKPQATANTGLASLSQSNTTASSPNTATQPSASADTKKPSCCDMPESTKALLANSPATQPATQPAAPSASAKKGVHASEWVEPVKRPEPYGLDYKMTTQDGKEITLKDLAGQPWALTFLFTKCPNPEMCPLIAVSAAKLQRELAKAGLADKTRVVVITYDLINDTPEILKEYGKARGFAFDDKNQAVMLRPNAQEFRSFVTEYQVGLVPTADGSINHTIELLLIDRKARFVRDYRGGVWDNKDVVEDLRKLAQEQD